jgi:hypothetical protein
MPRSTIQSVLDSVISSQSALKPALQFVLDSDNQLIPKSTIQSILESIAQPAPESAAQPATRLCAELMHHLRACIHVDSEVQPSVIFSVYGKVSIDEILSRAFQSW